jgi:tetratricopeptide (TPR) repeat protein
MDNNFIEAQKLYEEDKYVEALGIYSRLIEQNPTDTVAYQGASKCLYRLDKLEETIKTCEKALEINEKLPLIHVILASVYNRLENREKSRKEAEIALRLDANSPVVLGCYGTSLLADNKIGEAISYLEKSVKVDNTDYVFHYNLAIAYSKDKRWGETITELKNVNRLHPSVKTGFQIVIAYINKYRIIGSIGLLFLLTTIAAVAFSKKGLIIVSVVCLLFI